MNGGLSAGDLDAVVAAAGAVVPLLPLMPAAIIRAVPPAS